MVTTRHKLLIYCQIWTGKSASKRDSFQILNAFQVSENLPGDVKDR